MTTVVPAIQLDHVSRWYGNVVAVNDVSFALGSGVTGLLGPNGAGKSTLLHLLAGLLAPSAGTVRIAGRPAFGDPSIYSMVGLVPEREAVPGYLTGREFVRLNAELQGIDRRGRRHGPGDRHGRPGRCGRPPDPDLLEGHAPAGQARRGARPRAADPAARRAVQRHGSPPAAAHDGAAPADGRRGSGDPVLVAHPRGGRAARRRRAGRVCRPPRGIGRLPLDPPAHDRPAAPVHHPLVRRPGARRRRCLPTRPCSASSCSTAGWPSRPATYGAFTRILAPIARAAGIRLHELTPTDDSLESVFSYLVRR